MTSGGVGARGSLGLFSLAGRVALVTGGNGGLGRAMALGLGAAGARVAVTGRDAEKNRRVAAELAAALGEDSIVLSLDVTDEAGVRRVVDEVVGRFGRLDILVNNAGSARTGAVTEVERADWDATVALNLTGAFLCAKHAARAMLAGGAGGKIVNIASIYAHFGTPNFASYGAAKTGLVGLTRALAVELAPAGIQANAILPGWHLTDRTRRLAATPLGEQIRRKTPAARWGRPEDVVGAAIYLASSASDYVTGTCLTVDGGYSIAERLASE